MKMREPSSHEYIVFRSDSSGDTPASFDTSAVPGSLSSIMRDNILLVPTQLAEEPVEETEPLPSVVPQPAQSAGSEG